MSDALGGTRFGVEAFRRAGLLRRGGEGGTDGGYFREVIDALPVAVYITDAAGIITYYNEAAATLWGNRPELGKDQWCGSWKLFWPDGSPLPHHECPMAIALNEDRAIRGMEALALRPDGVGVPFMAYAIPLHDASGVMIGVVNTLVDITGRKQAERRVGESQSRYRAIFDSARVAMFEQDFSGAAALLAQLRSEGVSDLRAHLEAHPLKLLEAIRGVRIVDANAFATELFEAGSREALVASLADISLPEMQPVFLDQLATLWEGGRRFENETVMRTLKGRRIDVAFTVAFEGERCERALVSLLDISAQKRAERALRQQTHRLETLNRVARSISGDHDLERIVQTVTDAATDLSGARCGAFFYHAADEQGGRYRLSAHSGTAPAFEDFVVPRGGTPFDPTFHGLGIVRSDDIRSDPRHSGNAPPLGPLPVASYMAVPVVSRSGEVHGALLFAHEEPGIFSHEIEDVVAALAGHAAIAIDNARLFAAAQDEIEQRRHSEQAAQRLAAIVESSDDAILAKNLDGIITDWNAAAQRLFGYEPEEIIGRPVTVLMPIERHNEEPAILDRIRRGERIDHYETIRQRKDGSLVEISLTVSPVRDRKGTIVGASKIARDITDRRRAEQQQQLLLREMDHRVKNLFALASGVVTLSARSARSAEELGTAVRARLGALAQAHALTLRHASTPAGSIQATTLHALVRTILAPYEGVTDDGTPRLTLTGPDVAVGGGCVTSFALLLHEFATNAAKYGSLSSPGGHVGVQCADEGEMFVVTWRERGGPRLDRTDVEGFGTLLGRATVKGQLGGDIVREWDPEGLVIRLSVVRARLAN